MADFGRANSASPLAKVHIQTDLTGLGGGALKQKAEAACILLREAGTAIVAYSGGVDSSLVAYLAHRELGEKSLIVTAASPAVPDDEIKAASEQAGKFGWTHRIIDTLELEDPRYTVNDTRRCFFCKTELYTRLAEMAKQEKIHHIANGTNADDLQDYRPGLEAAKDFSVISPLAAAGISKKEVRILAQFFNLTSWDKPAQPCLASRLPYGSPVSVEALSMVGEAEAHLRKLGFANVRVRHHMPVARIEVDEQDFVKFASKEIRESVNMAIKAAGYRHAAVDLSHFQSGGLNYRIPQKQKKHP